MYCCQIGYSRPNRLRCSLLVCGDPAGTNPGRVGERIPFLRVRVVLTSPVVDLWAEMRTTGPMIRSQVTKMAAARATFKRRIASPPQQVSQHSDVHRRSQIHRRLPQLDGKGGGPACGSRRSLLRHLRPKHCPVVLIPAQRSTKSDVSITRTRRKGMRLPTWPGLVPARSPHTRRLQRSRFGR